MLLRDILHAKGAAVHTVSPDATLAEVVHRLVEHNCGSLVVCEPADSMQMVGIITERDILRACAAGRMPLTAHTVRECMTCNVVTGSPSQPVEETMGVLTAKRIRHMPIVEQNRLVGIISIGDVVKAQHDELTMENHYLKNYLLG
jgi:CBS domain-containing protein